MDVLRDETCERKNPGHRLRPHTRARLGEACRDASPGSDEQRKATPQSKRYFPTPLGELSHQTVNLVARVKVSGHEAYVGLADLPLEVVEKRVKRGEPCCKPIVLERMLVPTQLIRDFQAIAKLEVQRRAVHAAPKCKPRSVRRARLPDRRTTFRNENAGARSGCAAGVSRRMCGTSVLGRLSRARAWP
ncbi:hypothetical protein AKJ09_11335 [Labilithrix luteola]|uniref:Uncharacterized protein n=1 Tax=Labilithrix luteola TaxID=1391654 RepID=A0A0K1QG78_9BACT|nr:hypothetical protein AKJ09_11335 [Labilithrix luteola]